MKNTGSNAWENLQNTITSTLLVDIVLEGKEESLPLSQVRNLAYSPKLEERKAAYFAELKAYEKIEESWWCCTGTGMENPARYKR